MREDTWMAIKADGCKDMMEKASLKVSRTVFDAEKW
jgi:hypothetical protein